LLSISWAKPWGWSECPAFGRFEKLRTLSRRPQECEGYRVKTAVSPACKPGWHSRVNQIRLQSPEARIESASNVIQPRRISFYFILGVLILTGWLHLGPLLLAVLFSYFALTKLDFLKHRGRWAAITLFIVLLAIGAYGLTLFVQATAEALPSIAERSLPSITQWAASHQIVLPFTDLNSFKEEAQKMAHNEARDIGKFADFARGATRQFVYLMIGAFVAMGLFLDPKLEMDLPVKGRENNMYTLCCDEISKRFARFYVSFDMVMNAQVTISAINAIATGIFMTVLRLPHMPVAVGVSFICGMIPVVGNILSNIVVVAIGFIVSPAKGIGALAFLVTIHHLGFFLNSKIVGAKIRSPVWLTLVALVLGESLMGVTGMVLSPVVLHYIRMETADITVKPPRSQ
jgi:predicted PurR-regulated permease PerM